jgi:hypothetical protein
MPVIIRKEGLTHVPEHWQEGEILTPWVPPDQGFPPLPLKEISPFKIQYGLLFTKSLLQES